jgi:hypothetical protein
VLLLWLLLLPLRLLLEALGSVAHSSSSTLHHRFAFEFIANSKMVMVSGGLGVCMGVGRMCASSVGSRDAGFTDAAHDLLRLDAHSVIAVCCRP